MAKASLETLMAEIKKVGATSTAGNKKLSAIEKRLGAIEKDISDIKKFVATDNADFPKKSGSNAKGAFPMAAAPNK